MEIPPADTLEFRPHAVDNNAAGLRRPHWGITNDRISRGATIYADYETHSERQLSAIFNARACGSCAGGLREMRHAGVAARQCCPAIVPRRGAAAITLALMKRSPCRAGSADYLVQPPRSGRSTAERFLHCGNELLQREWFRQEAIFARFRQMFLEGVLSVAGYENDFQVWITDAQFARQRWAVHFRHDHVGDDDIDR